MPSRENEIGQNIAYFKEPKLYKPINLINNPNLVPKSKGLYGWYFNVLPPHVPQNKYINIDAYAKSFLSCNVGS